MNVYTLIIDFDGGTYVMQSMADSVEAAAIKCILEWQIDDIADAITEKDKKTIVSQFAEEAFIALDNTMSVWYNNVFLRDKLCGLYLVRTDNTDNKRE